jgi:hypothetical protein
LGVFHSGEWRSGNPGRPARPALVRHGSQRTGASAAIEIVQNFGKGTIANLPVPGTTNFQNAWQEIINSAEEANDPGRFTAFIGFEWTSNTAGNNLHRNILFSRQRHQGQHG